MRRAVFPLLLFLFGFILGLLCLFPIHTVSPKMDAAPLTASRAGEEPASTSEASTSRPAAGRGPRGGGAEGRGLWDPGRSGPPGAGADLYRLLHRGPER